MPNEISTKKDNKPIDKWESVTSLCGAIPVLFFIILIIIGTILGAIMGIINNAALISNFIIYSIFIIGIPYALTLGFCSLFYIKNNKLSHHQIATISTIIISSLIYAYYLNKLYWENKIYWDGTWKEYSFIYPIIIGIIVLIIYRNVVIEDK